MKLIKITEQLEKEIPHGYWCWHNIKVPKHKKWCMYLKLKAHPDSGDGKRWYCNHMEDFVNRKECGINEEVKA